MTDSQREAWTAFAIVAMLSVGIELFHRALLACILPSNDSDLAAALKQALQSLRPWGRPSWPGEHCAAVRPCTSCKLQRTVENSKSAQAWWTSSHCDAGCFQERRLSKQPAGDKKKTFCILSQIPAFFLQKTAFSLVKSMLVLESPG